MVNGRDTHSSFFELSDGGQLKVVHFDTKICQGDFGCNERSFPEAMQKQWKRITSLVCSSWCCLIESNTGKMHLKDEGFSTIPHLTVCHEGQAQLIFCIIHSTHASTDTVCTRQRFRSPQSPRERPSEGFDGEGTLANHVKIEACDSVCNRISSRLFATADLALPDIETSRTPLLSMKKTVGQLCIVGDQSSIATTSAKSSASKMIVSLICFPAKQCANRSM